MEYIRELYLFVQANGWAGIHGECKWQPFLEWVSIQYPNDDLLQKAMEIIEGYNEN